MSITRAGIQPEPVAARPNVPSTGRFEAARDPGAILAAAGFSFVEKDAFETAARCDEAAADTSIIQELANLRDRSVGPRRLIDPCKRLVIGQGKPGRNDGVPDNAFIKAEFRIRRVLFRFCRTDRTGPYRIVGAKSRQIDPTCTG